MFPQLKTPRLLFLLAALCLAAASSCGGGTPPPGGVVHKNMTAFEGGKFDASGVTGVPGADGVLFVDNGREGHVCWMGLDREGRQLGEIKMLDLGVGIEDLEGITTDGTHFYVVSSQSRPKAIEKAGLARFKFDARSQRIEGVEAISGLKEFLITNVAELREEGEKKGKEGGLNIEGLAWDPRRGRLLLGLRSPVVDGHALVVPLRLRDPRGTFSTENLQVEGPAAIRLNLGGVGIRGIEYDGRANLFRVISGATEDQGRTDFGLWEWNGDEQQPALTETKRFEDDLKPEGVARVTAGGRDFIFIICDASGYTIMN